jgi:hypothetical protein
MQALYGRVLAALADSEMAGEQTLVIAEHDKRFDPGVAWGRLQKVRQITQGDAGLSFYRKS